MHAGPDVPEIAKQVETGLAIYKLDGSVIIVEAIKASSYELEGIEALTHFAGDAAR